MKFLFDLFPVILFFGIFRWGEKNSQAAQEIVSKKGEKMTIEYKNMKIGAQSADLFKLPAGAKIQDMNAMMQNMPKGKQP